MVELTLVMPILIILFVGIADFGRVFNAGVVMEAAARNAAEHAAQKYLADPPGDPALTPAERLSAPAPAGDSGYYGAIRDDVGRTVCAEARGLTNTDYAGGSCATWPVVGVCVHDGSDPACGTAPAGFGSAPADCTEISGSWSNATASNGERWVEVRVCYRFSSILRLPFFSFGDIYLERTRSFAVPCYFATGFGGCG